MDDGADAEALRRACAGVIDQDGAPAPAAGGNRP